MRSTTFTAAAVLTCSALVAAELMPYKLDTVGTRSANPAYGLAKRKDGYQPTGVRCGPGVDCAASCGTNYIKCASNDGALHCYDPTVKKESCCPDGNGYSCREGYICTSDSVGGTWCCPNGMDLVTCAKNYHLTDSLVAQTPTATPTATSRSYYQYQYPNTTISGTGGKYTPTPIVDPPCSSDHPRYTYTPPTYPNTTYTPPSCTESCDSTPTYYPPGNPGNGNKPDHTPKYPSYPGYPGYTPVGTAPYGTAPYGTAPYGTAPTKSPTGSSAAYIPPVPTVPTSPPTPSLFTGGANVYAIGLPAVLLAAVGFAVAF